METMNSLIPYVSLFIIGMVASMGALGVGLGAFLTSRTLANYLNKLYFVSQDTTSGTPAAEQSEIQEEIEDTEEQPGTGFLGGDNDCYSFCKTYSETGSCPPSCPMIFN